jgi:hypothetical protein
MFSFMNCGTEKALAVSTSAKWSFNFLVNYENKGWLPAADAS